MSKIVIAAMYHFAPFPDYEAKRADILALMGRNEIKGSLLIASEGINGTVAGPREAIDKLLAYIRALPGFADIQHKESYDEEQPFYRTKVRLKKEIVTMGVPMVDPTAAVGKYVEPKDWNDLISDPDTILIDTRNTYETKCGTFKGAIDPRIETFREFPQIADDLKEKYGDKKIAMFCTGGIRCEKSTSYLAAQGFEEVYHLKGGILKYFEDVDKEDSMWEGECFVFDNRVTVNHDLEPGGYDQCHACREPITEDDKQSDHYEPGVCCPSCYDKLTPERKARFEQRQKQIALAKERGERHIGTAH